MTTKVEIPRAEKWAEKSVLAPEGDGSSGHLADERRGSKAN